ncbi:alpha/beta hydrolase [Variovorax sp. PCZ-1]|uniref:RBBP9/YdeN family alpha/beta hydrolase n=1 Tax=Variovorax sp. PCZ-1 TaxID=2835533 RepID=UPI001BCBBFC2|nr:alpha/beta hydrolase [Variovorax sp. PCZ-1]MBS7808710.1 alpha/beta hydrolase [Variovorax sp. PCZ-1]
MTTYLILPGWQNSGPQHWQSLWETQLPAQRVMQHDWMHPLRGDWITRLEDHLLSITEHPAQQLRRQSAENALKNDAKDIVFISHSLGCHLVAAWAALSKQTHRIRGALLVAPPDGLREQFPQELKSWRPPVLQKLPFPSICVISSNDPFCDLQPGKDMAAAWGSELIELGDKGHINADSGLGDWPQGCALLNRLAS